MLDGDLRRIKMVYSLLFALPGTPVLFYGEEIGMGENLAVEGRSAVRTPMQWEPGPSGGFSTADPSKFPAPVVTGPYSPDAVNALDQRHDPNSLLSWIKRLVERYRECPELPWGDFELLNPGDEAVLAHRCTSDGSSVTAVHNLSDRTTTANIDLPDGNHFDLLAESDVTIHNGRLEIAPYGCHWFRSNK
ncbi:alpha-glucosidase C-terminal domain-containing protein [Actinokineospora soli]|uniref:Alpha-glucosidase C-terminal domain-containing protein n=1 Tax=Actinokineospora soli TaxID=1048753 RepID=A0ABW2TLD2_9PSEU